jgi:hypothetical protein
MVLISRCVWGHRWPVESAKRQVHPAPSECPGVEATVEQLELNELPASATSNLSVLRSVTVGPLSVGSLFSRRLLLC